MGKRKSLRTLEKEIVDDARYIPLTPRYYNNKDVVDWNGEYKKWLKDNDEAIRKNNSLLKKLYMEEKLKE